MKLHSDSFKLKTDLGAIKASRSVFIFISRAYRKRRPSILAHFFNAQTALFNNFFDCISRYLKMISDVTHLFLSRMLPLPKKIKSKDMGMVNTGFSFRGRHPMILRKGLSILFIASLGLLGCDSHDGQVGGGSTKAEQSEGSIGQDETASKDATARSTKDTNSSNTTEGDSITDGDPTAPNGEKGKTVADKDKPFDPDADLGAEVLELPSGLSLRNFRGIEATLLSISGFNDWPAETQVVLNDVNPLLPRGFDPAQFGGTVQQAVTKLAHSLAVQMMTDANIRERFFGATDLTGAPATVFSAAGRAAIFTSVLEEVGRGTVINKEEQEQALDSLVTGLLAENLTSTDISVALLVQVMSSTDVLFEM